MLSGRSPLIALRIAGPFPAVKTPLLLNGTKSHSLIIALSVPNPIPARNAKSHQRNFQAKEALKRLWS